MSQKSVVPTTKAPAEQVVRDIRRATRKHHSAEDKIRIVLEGLRGEDSIAALCRGKGIRVMDDERELTLMRWGAHPARVNKCSARGPAVSQGTSIASLSGNTFRTS